MIDIYFIYGIMIGWIISGLIFILKNIIIEKRMDKNEKKKI